MNPRKTALCPLSTAHSYQEEKRVNQAHSQSSQIYSSEFTPVSEFSNQSLLLQDLCGGPVVKTPSFQYRRHRFDPWSGEIPYTTWCGRTKQQNKIENSLLWKRSKERESGQGETGALPPGRKKPQEWRRSVPFMSPHIVCLFSFCLTP